jgi:hypothetical protein
MQRYDNWCQQRNEVIRLWLRGKSVGEICGLTGVPAIRIMREMDLLAAKDPSIQRRRAESLYPSNRHKYSASIILIDPRERYRSFNEY